MSNGTVGGQTPTPGEIHHRLQRAIFDPSPARIALSVAGYISEREQAEKHGITLTTLRRWRRRNYGPKGVQVGRKFLYRDDASERWLEEQEAAAAAAAEPRRRR
jgi:hypothetical protein